MLLLKGSGDKFEAQKKFSQEITNYYLSAVINFLLKRITLLTKATKWLFYYYSSVF